MDVSDVLRDRVGEPSGFERMAIMSALLHAAVAAAVLLAPGRWLARSTPPPRTVMTITLSGGNGGPSNGGMTAIGGRAVQAETPPEAPRRPEAIRPPAARTPDVTVPVPSKAAPRKKPAPGAVVKQAPDEARGTTPVKGAEVREGSAVAETGARGLGFGLSTSGGSGTGSTLDITGDFCCPEYLTFMIEKIRTNWSARAEVAGQVLIKYTIQRDGTIVSPEIEKSSGYTVLDVSALRAVAGTRQILPLPGAFPNPSLTVHLNFQYTR